MLLMTQKSETGGAERMTAVTNRSDSQHKKLLREMRRSGILPEITEQADQRHFYLAWDSAILINETAKNTTMKTDAQLQKDIMAELKYEPMLDAATIGVGVHHGVVTLSGNVSSFSKKMITQRAAWRVKGVKAVALEVAVVLPDDDLLTDAVIAENVLNALKWNTSIPEDRIRVKVADREVFLQGEVDWAFQKEAAFEAIKLLRSIRHIGNLITVKPLVNTSSIKDHITEALLRRANVEAAGIQIEATGNKVTLKGTVHSWDERTEAAHAAWSAPGVAMVDDQLVIDYD